MEIHLQRMLLIVITVLLIPVTLICSTNTSTVCYGSADPSCTTHRLSCPSRLVIQIINTSYGYRPGCNNVMGLNNCDNTTCCNEESGDCFIPFSYEDDQQVAINCNGKNTCDSRGLRRYDITDTVCDGRVINAYNKIQYKCITTGISSTTSTQTTSQSSTSATSTSKGSSVVTSSTSSHETIAGSSHKGISSTTLTPTAYQSSTSASSTTKESVADGSSDAGSIVGGLFGAIIIIVFIVLVVLFLYKRRKRALSQPSTNKETTFQTKTHYPTIGGPNSSTFKTKNTSGFDEIDLNCKPDSPDRISNMRNHDHSVHEDNYNYIGEKFTRPTQHDTNYNHITGVLGTSNVEDDYNHIGGNDSKKVITNDNYHHIRNNLSTSPRQLDTDYNHIAGVLGSSTVEDDYNHIGNNDNKKVIIDDNYHHIRSGDIQVEGDYNHIGSDELTSGSNDHYNHIPDDNNHARESDSHNLDGDEAPYNFATC